MNQVCAAGGLRSVPPRCCGNGCSSTNPSAPVGGIRCFKTQIRILLISSISITAESPAMHRFCSRYCSCFLNDFSDSEVCSPLGAPPAFQRLEMFPILEIPENVWFSIRIDHSYRAIKI